MNTYEILGLFQRNPAIEARVHEFEYQVRNWYGGNYNPEDSGEYGYAIPKYGIAVNDAVLGWVAIFPDQNGVLIYTADIAPTLGEEINKPVYQSPWSEQGGGLSGVVVQVFDDLKKGLGSIALGLGVVIGLWILLETKPWK
jgi:hypothetical protein